MSIPIPSGLFLFLLAGEDRFYDLRCAGFHEFYGLLLEDVGVLEGCTHEFIDDPLDLLSALGLSELLLGVAHGHDALAELPLLRGDVHLELLLQVSPFMKKLDLC
jgi:hypothetical protein